jgi:crossover junction endodeoxyribonuclease RusA
VPLAITFHAPDKRRRDMDNAIAAMKPQLDGLADAMRVDDNRFRLSFAWESPASTGGSRS